MGSKGAESKQRYEKVGAASGVEGQMAGNQDDKGKGQGLLPRGLGGKGEAGCAKSKGGNPWALLITHSRALPIPIVLRASIFHLLHFLLPTKAQVLCSPMPSGLSLAVSSRRGS